MALQNWRVAPISRKAAEQIIKQWHYSGSLNGVTLDYCYGLFDEAEWLQGAICYGKMAMAGQWRKFGEHEEDVIELRRLACVDDTPRNAESFLIGRSLKMLGKDWGGKVVVSYADAEYGHAGTIYKASNFESGDYVKGAKVIVWNGKRYHDKSLRTKYNGVLKPFAQRLASALESGEATWHKTAGKHTYIYKLKRK